MSVPSPTSRPSRLAPDGRNVAASEPAMPPKSPSHAPDLDLVDFFGSQIGDQSVINYSYTDSPWILLAWDTYYFFYYIWALPYIIFPYKPADSGPLSELSLTRGNIFCVFIHTILVIIQLAFILLLPPLALLLPLWTTILGIIAFMLVVRALCALLNGEDIIFHSDPQYAKPAQPRFAHEQWVFLNGVAVGSHWMKSNLNRLALTFGRPIVGIHNRTSGILFDVVECLIQRNFTYATNDVRVCYRIMKEKLYDPRYSKVVFIVHSQGGIEGGLVLDWLLQELPQNLLAKLEVYSFGNAANHFNNPYRTVGSQAKAEGRPLLATKGANGAVGMDEETSESKVMENGNGNEAGGRHETVRALDRRPSTPASPPPLKTNTGITALQQYAPVTETPISNGPSQRPSRAIHHIEHYAFTTDFVALWGVLHFAATPTASRIIPRFLGRVFAYQCPNGRGGHQLVQHYLDGMFPLERDSATGQFVGAKETGNAFMESYVTVRKGGASGEKDANKGKIGAREDIIGSWLDCLDGDDGANGDDDKGSIDMYNADSPVAAAAARRKRGLPAAPDTVQVKELSRLWKYRNGRCPMDKPPSLAVGPDVAVRNATL
ncbi:unnamed protein product [Discula destructiva]